MSKRLILVVLSIALSLFACEDRDGDNNTTTRDTRTSNDVANDTGDPQDTTTNDTSTGDTSSLLSTPCCSTSRRRARTNVLSR